MLFAVGAALVGGALNAISGSAQDREMEKRKQAAIAQLKQNIIDPAELDTMLNNVNRLFNNRLVNTLNSTALRSRGVANSGVVKGVVAGQLEAGRLGAINQTQLEAQKTNQQTYSQMAGIESSMGGSHNAFGDFASGALAAAPVGMELSKMLSPNTITPGAQPTASSTDIQTPSIASNFTGDLTNPFMGKTNISDEDLTNFSPTSWGNMYKKKPWEL